MRGRSYSYSPTPPPRGYSRRYRSPSPRGNYRSRDGPTSLLVRNLRHDCRPEDLRVPFGRYGPVKDVYLPRDYYTGEPRGFGFVQFMDPTDAADAKYDMDGYVLHGRELTVVFAEENRKKPSEMRARDRKRGPSYDQRNYSRSPGYRRPDSRNPGNSPRRRHQSRSISPYEKSYRRRSYRRASYSRSRYGSRSRSPDDRSYGARSRSGSLTPY